ARRPSELESYRDVGSRAHRVNGTTKVCGDLDGKACDSAHTARTGSAGIAKTMSLADSRAGERIRPRCGRSALRRARRCGGRGGRWRAVDRSGPRLAGEAAEPGGSRRMAAVSRRRALKATHAVRSGVAGAARALEWAVSARAPLCDRWVLAGDWA